MVPRMSLLSNVCAALGRAARSLALFLTLTGVVSQPCVAGNNVAANKRDQLETALQSQIDSLSNDINRPADRDALKSFYGDRGYRPLWVDNTGPTRAAAKVINELNSAADWGLSAADFPLTAVKTPRTFGHWTATETAAAEYEISASVLKYARQAGGGRITDPGRTLSSYLDRRPVLVEPLAVLGLMTSTADPDAALRDFHPVHEQFQKLRQLYAELRAGAQLSQAAGLPLKGPTLLPGVSHADVKALRQRLSVPPVDGNDELYDAAVKAAVKTFQASVDLDDDGLFGPATRKALVTGNADHLKSVLATMEQWRWMPADLGQTHLLVNVPAFSVRLVQNGVTTLEERVIVGKSTTQTPIFSKKLTTIVLKPSWQLPDSIKLEKLLTAQRSGTPIEDEGYIIKKGDHVVDSGSVDWNTADINAYALFQPSGDGNALGAVKFLFPNKHSVYLHDTPSKSLFDASERLYSHGCVRLRNPLALAQRLLDLDKGAGALNVKEEVREGEANNQVSFDTPVPVHVAYLSVWIGKDGRPQYHGDPYGHEERIALALEQKWDEIDKGADHLAKIDTRQLKSVSVQAPSRKVERTASRAAPQTAARAAQRRAFQSASTRRARNFDPPSGLINANAQPKFRFFKSAKARANTGGVGEMMRSALQR
jgi:L,D-transpeptidase YcbB